MGKWPDLAGSIAGGKRRGQLYTLLSEATGAHVTGKQAHYYRPEGARQCTLRTSTRLVTLGGPVLLQEKRKLSENLNVF